MITFDQVSVVYDGADEPVLRDVDLKVDEGEPCLLVGHTGVGKSTLLGAVNGLVPHFTGGTLYGTVTVDGRDTADHPPRELADAVGVVSYLPGLPFTEQWQRYLAFDVATSLDWDTGRAVTNFVCVTLAGPAVLTTFRRAARKARYRAPVRFAPRKQGGGAPAGIDSGP